MSPAEEGNIKGSTWLIRTRFSRSVCYGLNSSSLSNISGPLLEDSNPKEFVNIMKENPNLFFALPESTDIGDLDVQRSNSDTAMAKNAAVYPSLSSECLNPLLYTSNSVNTSPEKMSAGHGYRHQRSLSLPSTCGSGRIDEDDGAYSSSGEYSSDGSKTDDASQMDAGRAASWSEYFVKSATGLATEEADDCTIDLSNLLLGNKFASGAYSRLYLGKYNDVPVAVKMLRKPDDDEEISRRLDRQFQAEVNALSRVSHRNVIKFYGACKKSPVCCIVMEYAPLGSVRVYLHNQPIPLPLKTVVDMALDIARGMEYLHAQGVIHRDLKSENLVIAEDMCIKITDFGVACFESETSPMTDDVGTYRWMAPEMISKKRYSKKADVYSFGIVLWELITCHIPFEEYTPVQAAFAKVHKHSRPPLPLNCPSVLSHLMQQCWHVDPDKRPNFTKVVGVLEEIQQDILQNRSLPLFHRPHKHVHGLLHCFGRGSSHHIL